MWNHVGDQTLESLRGRRHVCELKITGRLSTSPDFISDQLVLFLKRTRAQTQRCHNVVFKTKPKETQSLDIKKHEGSASLWFAEINIRIYSADWVY